MTSPAPAQDAFPDDPRLCLELAERWLQSAPDAAIAHRLRNHMGALSAALDVNETSDAGSAIAQEAAEVAARHAAALAELLAAAPAAPAPRGQP